MSERRVVITGMGVVSPIGIGLDSFWSSLINGKSGIQRISSLDPSDFYCQIGGEVNEFEPNPYLYKKYLLNLKKKDKNLFINNFALGKNNSYKTIYNVYYKSKNIHFLNSFSKKYISNSIKITFPKIKNKIEIKKKKIKCKKLDDIKFKFAPCFIKLDTEGNDYDVLKGAKKLLKENKPVLLIEFNSEYHNRIKKLLKNYNSLIYNFKDDKFYEINRITRKKISRSSKFDYLTNRNVFFIPKGIKYH